MRYKLAVNFLAFIQPASIRLSLRANESTLSRDLGIPKIVGRVGDGFGQRPIPPITEVALLGFDA